MKPVPQRRIAHRFIALAVCALAVAPAWLQAAAPAAAEAAHAAETAYRAERAACLSGRSQQDRATCLKEAGAVRAERRSGRLDSSASAATLQANALKRCEVQPPQARGDCERLARGEGSRDGTVEGGGVIKEVVTRIPAPDAPASAVR